jgi:hypothetical protein
MTEAQPDVSTSSPGQRASERGSRGDDPVKTVITVVVLVLGVMLGIVDQGSAADAGLRIPALIASLLLVADSINILLAAGRGPVGEVPAPAPGSGPEQVSSTIPLVLLALAVWLGIATLNYDAEGQLITMSLIAAFLIFSRGLADLPGR